LKYGILPAQNVRGSTDIFYGVNYRQSTVDDARWLALFAAHVLNARQSFGHRQLARRAAPRRAARLTTQIKTRHVSDGQRHQ